MITLLPFNKVQFDLTTLQDDYECNCEYGFDDEGNNADQVVVIVNGFKIINIVWTSDYTGTGQKVDIK